MRLWKNLEQSKYLKKYFVVCCIIMIVTLAGCGGSSESESDTEQNTVSEDSSEDDTDTTDETTSEDAGVDTDADTTEETDSDEDTAYESWISNYEESASIYYEGSYLFGDYTTEMKVWIKGDKTRMEVSSMGISSISISDGESYYTLDETTKTATKITMDMEEAESDLEGDSYSEDYDVSEILGETNYEGEETVGDWKTYVFYDEQNDIRYWIDQESGFPVKVEGGIGDEVYIMEMTAISTESISDDVFVVPSDYTIQDLTSILDSY